MTGADAVADGLRLMFSRPAGAAWLLHGLWKALDVDSALRKVLGPRRFTTDVERVLFALVANRAIDPASKLAAAEWASYDVAIPGLKAWRGSGVSRRFCVGRPGPTTRRVTAGIPGDGRRARRWRARPGPPPPAGRARCARAASCCSGRRCIGVP